MLYFSTRDVNPDDVDTEQIVALRKFRDACKERGLLDFYANPTELKQKILRGLPRLVETLTSRVSAPKPAAAPSMLASELRRWAKEWELLARQGYPAIADAKDIADRFVRWYLSNLDALPGPAESWTALGDLAKQLEMYRFAAGRESSELFFTSGKAILDVASELLETGKLQPPTDIEGVKVLKQLGTAKTVKHRQTAAEIAENLHAQIADVEAILEALSGEGLVDSRTFIGRHKSDHALTGSGMVWVAALAD